MPPFKPVSADIAIEAGAPIVPMAIVGSRKVHEPGSTHLRQGRGELRVGEPIPAASLRNRDAKETIARVQEDVSRTWRAAHWEQ